ncbi:MAG TPA: DUF5908 family protein [Alphaproteobacteria bacterium]|nr:DUF5908 family protein [Alphaproteobacteria bacterium]
MAVVITELIIRARVGAPEPADREQTETERREDRARLVEDTAAEVMRLLRREREA